MALFTLTAGVLLPAAATGQAEFRITEVGFTAGGWVEVANLGDAAGSLDGWSLYHADVRPNQVGASWWPFPVATTLGAGERMRVQWMQAGSNGSGVFFTGTRPQDFLFGIRGVTFDPTQGAVALIAATDAPSMARPDSFRDWMNWGRTGHNREDLAVLAGLWRAGESARDGNRFPRPSLALDEVGRTHPAGAATWYRDESPTPGGGNHPGYAPTVEFGEGCEYLVRAPRTRLATRGVAAVGNLDFALQLRHDRVLPPGPWTASFILGVGPNRTVLRPPFAPACRILVDNLQLVTAFVQENRALQEYPVRLPVEVVGVRLFVQAVVIHDSGFTFDFALTNRVEITAGG